MIENIQGICTFKTKDVATKMLQRERDREGDRPPPRAALAASRTHVCFDVKRNLSS